MNESSILKQKAIVLMTAAGYHLLSVTSRQSTILDGGSGEVMVTELSFENDIKVCIYSNSDRVSVFAADDYKLLPVDNVVAWLAEQRRPSLTAGGE